MGCLREIDCAEYDFCGLFFVRPATTALHTSPHSSALLLLSFCDTGIKNNTRTHVKSTQRFFYPNFFLGGVLQWRNGLVDCRALQRHGRAAWLVAQKPPWWCVAWGGLTPFYYSLLPFRYPFRPSYETAAQRDYRKSHCAIDTWRHLPLTDTSRRFAQHPRAWASWSREYRHSDTPCAPSPWSLRAWYPPP